MARALADSLIGAERFARLLSSENAVADSSNRVPTFQRTQSIKSFVENLNLNRRLASPVLKNNAMHIGVLTHMARERKMEEPTANLYEIPPHSLNETE